MDSINITHIKTPTVKQGTASSLLDVSAACGRFRFSTQPPTARTQTAAPRHNDPKCAVMQRSVYTRSGNNDIVRRESEPIALNRAHRSESTRGPPGLQKGYLA